jgi:hypothetical protein
MVEENDCSVPMSHIDEHGNNVSNIETSMFEYHFNLLALLDAINCIEERRANRRNRSESKVQMHTDTGGIDNAIYEDCCRNI